MLTRTTGMGELLIEIGVRILLIPLELLFYFVVERVVFSWWGLPFVFSLILLGAVLVMGLAA